MHRFFTGASDMYTSKTGLAGNSLTPAVVVLSLCIVVPRDLNRLFMNLSVKIWHQSNYSFHLFCVSSFSPKTIVFKFALAAWKRYAPKRAKLRANNLGFRWGNRLKVGTCSVCWLWEVRMNFWIFSIHFEQHKCPPYPPFNISYGYEYILAVHMVIDPLWNRECLLGDNIVQAIFREEFGPIFIDKTPSFTFSNFPQFSQI